MKRLQQEPAVNDATRSGKVVVACAYNTHVPDSIRAQLPANAGQQFVARIEDGRVVQIVRGRPEAVIHQLLE